MMHTTININLNVLRKLNMASLRTGLSRSKLISILVATLIEKTDTMDVQSDKLTRYQPRGADNCYSQMHIYMKEPVYHYCIDMRRFFKMSVSMIIAYAITQYLERLLKKLARGKDYEPLINPFTNYFLFRDLIDGVRLWRIYWGIPSNHDYLLLKKIQR